MKISVRTFSILTSLVLLIGLAGCATFLGKEPKLYSGGPLNCSRVPANRPVTINSSTHTVSPDPVDACPGDFIIWSIDKAPATFNITFDLSVVSSPLAATGPSVTYDHPARAATLPNTGKVSMVTGYDAAIVFPDSPMANCMVTPPLNDWQYCYKYTVSFSDGTSIDPHVIIMPPTN